MDKERSLFSRVMERRTSDAARLSRAAFMRRWGRFHIIYDDPEALMDLVVERFKSQSDQESARVIRSQRRIEKLLRDR